MTIPPSRHRVVLLIQELSYVIIERTIRFCDATVNETVC